RAFLGVAEAYNRLDGIDGQRRIDVQALLSESHSRIVPLQRRRASHAADFSKARPTGKRFAIAASLVAVAVLLGAAGYGFLRTNPDDADYRTAVGEQREIKLADGSLVRMNAHSQIHVEFGKSVREIRLVDGEALFKVAPERARPFLVIAGRTTIRAL